MSRAKTFALAHLPFRFIVVCGLDRWGQPHIELCRRDVRSSKEYPTTSGPRLNIIWGGWSATGLDYESRACWCLGIGRLWIEYC